MSAITVMKLCTKFDLTAQLPIKDHFEGASFAFGNAASYTPYVIDDFNLYFNSASPPNSFPLEHNAEVPSEAAERSGDSDSSISCQAPEKKIVSKVSHSKHLSSKPIIFQCLISKPRHRSVESKTDLHSVLSANVKPSGGRTSKSRLRR
jgi:hypothetical protein